MHTQVQRKKVKTPALPAADLARLFDAAPGCFMVLAADGPRFTIVAATDAYLHATKTERAVIIGKGVFEVFPDNPAEPEVKAVDFARASFQRVADTGRPDVMGIRQHDIRRPAAEGGGFETRLWNAVNTPVPGADGRVAYIMHRVEDVTETARLKQKATDEHTVNAELRASRKAALHLMEDARLAQEQAERTAEQLQQSQQTFSELIERAPFGIYVVDAAFCIAQMNRSSQTGAFRNVRPLLGRPFTEAMHTLWPDPVAEEIIGHFRHTLTTGEPYYSHDFVRPRQDTDAVEGYEWELHRLKLPDGQFGVICYFFDSTALRTAEVALRASEEQFRVLIENLVSAVALIDEHGAFALVNRSFLRLFGLADASTIKNVNDRDWSQWQVFDEHGALLGVDEHPVRKAVLTHQAVRNQLVAVQAPGQPERKWILVSAEPLLDARGQVQRVICSYHDITERKQANEELETFNATMVGRELRMIELKQELNAVCAQHGLPPRYATEDGEAPS